MRGLGLFSRIVHRTATGPLLVAAAMLSMAPLAAWADSCLEKARRLAAAYDLTIDPPDAGHADTNAPGRWGSVIEPPPSESEAVVEPDQDDTSYGMTTLPDISDATDRRGASYRQSALSATERTVLKSILVAARAEALRGQPKDCFERLGKAKELVLHHSDRIRRPD